MTIRILAPLALLAAFPQLAGAQPLLSPGLWSYDAVYALGPIPLRESGTHCVDEAMAGSSYEAILNDINDNCRVTSSETRPDGYHFTMQCAGGPDGELGGHLSVDQGAAFLNANGWTGTAQDNVPVSLSASAERISGTCAG